jgi:hypothetical protein
MKTPRDKHRSPSSFVSVARKFSRHYHQRESQKAGEIREDAVTIVVTLIFMATGDTTPAETVAVAAVVIMQEAENWAAAVILTVRKEANFTAPGTMQTIPTMIMRTKTPQRARSQLYPWRRHKDRRS